MAFRKIVVIMSGGGSTGLVKMSGSFDGLNKVKGECKCDMAGGESKLYVLADEITEITLDSDKNTFEMPIAAKNDIYCLLATGGKTLIGSSGGRADRRQLEGRIDLYKREKTKQAKARRESLAREREAERRERVERQTENEEAFAAPSSDDGKDGAYQPQAPRREEGLRRAQAQNSAREERSVPSPFADLQATGKARNSDDGYVNSVLRGGVTYDGTNFYQAIKPQLDEMFVRYPAEERLNAVVPNSKWVRIDVDDDDYYVLGVLFDLSEPTFICYGIPGVRTVAPPSEIADVSVWLPLDNAHSDGAGFWVIYQSAHNGKCIR